LETSKRPEAMQKRYPFPFLDAYEREDRDFFFGRDEEIETLYQLTQQSNIIILYGSSGTGKTSLIRCGLSNKFKSYDWQDMYIRRGEHLIRSLDRVLCEEADRRYAPAESDGKAIADLPQKLEAVYKTTFKPLYLIFDQFEEIYTLGSKDEEQAFIATVREILRVEQPVKIILSIREEYLGYLYEFERQVPELLRKKLRIEPMFSDRVQQVILSVGSLPQSNVKLQAGEEPAIATRIFEKLRGQDKTLGIQLPYLQVLLDKYYLHCTHDESRQAEATFTLATLDTLGDLGDVLRNFLDEQVQHIARQLDQPVEPLWQLLSPFVTLDGTKEPLSEAELRSRLPDDFPTATVAPTLQAFVQRRVLRYMEQTARYEVAHDTLAKQLHARRSDEEIALLEVQRLIRSQVAIKAGAREHFSAKQLAFIEPYLSQIKLSREEQDWIEKSQEQKGMEEQRQQEELEASRKRVQRGRWALVIIVLVLIGAIGLLINNIILSRQTKATLSELEERNNDVVQLIINNVNQEIVKLNYESALTTIRSANSLKAERHEVAKSYMEIILWYCESNKIDTALNILKDISDVTGLISPDESFTTKESLRGVLKSIDSIHFKFLFEERYYPNMVTVKGGSFQMGCSRKTYPNCKKEETLHLQEVSDFKIAKHETTVWQFALYCFANGLNIKDFIYSAWGESGDNPVVNINWHHTVNYANWVSRQKGITEAISIDSSLGVYSINLNANGYRLPTEAEWEYAAKGGINDSSHLLYSGSNELSEVGWYAFNSTQRIRTVGQKKPNSLGLYDMSGNVWEWCWDWFEQYLQNPPKDYPGPINGTMRVLRGGSWLNGSDYCRVAVRSNFKPTDKSSNYGFRVAQGH